MGVLLDAKLFKSIFEESKRIVNEECDLYNGKGDRDNEENGDEESDEDDDINSEIISEDKNCEEVTKKISELDVSNEKN